MSLKVYGFTEADLWQWLREINNRYVTIRMHRVENELAMPGFPDVVYATHRGPGFIENKIATAQRRGSEIKLQKLKRDQALFLEGHARTHKRAHIFAGLVDVGMEPQLFLIHGVHAPYLLKPCPIDTWRKIAVRVHDIAQLVKIID